MANRNKNPFYRADSDVDAVSKIIRDTQQDENTTATVEAVYVTGQLQVRLRGSTKSQTIDVLSGQKYQVGDLIYLAKINQRWTAIGSRVNPSIPGAASSVALESSSTTITPPIAPSSLMTTSGYGSIIVAWTPPPNTKNIYYDLQISDTSSSTGAITISAYTTSYVYATSDHLTKYFRVRTVNDNGDKSGWTAWVSGFSYFKLNGSSIETKTHSDNSLSSLSVSHLDTEDGAGTGYIHLGQESADPTAPSSGLIVYSDNSGNLAYRHTNGKIIKITDSNTANRNYGLPDASGTIVLDTAAQTLSNKTLTLPTIADFTNAQHSHHDAVSGGSLDLTTDGGSTILPLVNGGSGSDLSATGPGFLQQASNGANVTILKHNFNAMTSPGDLDDASHGYHRGSRWINRTAMKEYVCLVDSTGYAVWGLSTPSTEDMIEAINKAAEADVTMTLANTDYDALTLGLTPGVWFLSGKLVCTNAALAMFSAKLWDNVNVYEAGQAYSKAVSIPFSTIATINTETNFKITVQSDVALSSIISTNFATQLTAIKLEDIVPTVSGTPMGLLLALTRAL